MASRYNNQRPTDLGITDGKFKPCPATPNCVSTQASSSDKRHFIEPVSFTGSAPEVIQKVAKILSQKSQTVIVSQTTNYLHAEITIALFGFIDDLEFFADENTHLLHFRSASRMGTHDLWVNRMRMNRFKREFNK